MKTDIKHESCAQLINSSGVKFGTSGARGLVIQFTPELCAAFTTAFLNTTGLSATNRRLAVAMDRRPSSPELAAACIGAAKSLGFSVEFMGIIPTPALALYSISHKIPAIMVTGSHIPFDRNGLKFYRPEGEITKADESAILSCQSALPDFSPQLPAALSSAREGYIQDLLQRFPGKPLQNMRIGLYEHSAAGREVSATLLSQLGAEVISLGRTDTFVPIDTEAVSPQDIERGKHWAEEWHLDAILSTDGDGDRPLLADERGRWMRGDVLGLLCAHFLGIPNLAVPVNCNSAIELSGFFTRVIRTRIGSPYVIEGMQQLGQNSETVAGFEANGGFLTQALPTRDALLPALTILVNARTRGLQVSELQKGLPRRVTCSDRLQNVSEATIRPWLIQWQQEPASMGEFFALQSDVNQLSDIDGLRATLANGDVVHIRPSGNAPELRCYVESDSEHAANQLLAHVYKALERQLLQAP